MRGEGQMRDQIISGVALLTLVAGAAAHAQTVSSETAQPSVQPAQDVTGAAQGSTGLEEIVVTAQRVTETSQKAAVAIDVVRGADLVRAGVSAANELTQLVPALTAVSEGSYNFFFIRGVGNYSVTSYSDPAIAFNYDGVYVGRPTSAAGVFYDLDRVEVLKGPQGTLYGRNATGGAINVLPTQPRLGEFSGWGSVSYGNYSAFNLQGALNAPLGDDTALRIAGNVVDHGPYLKDGTDDEKTQAVRLQIKSEPIPDLTVRVSADYAHDGGTGAGYSYVDKFTYNPTLTSLPIGQRFNVTPSGLSLVDGAFSQGSQAFRESATAGPAGGKFDALNSFPFLDDAFYGVNAQIDYETELGTLTIIPAWRGAHLDNLGGEGFFVQERETDRQTSVEARLAKAGVGIFDYNVGVYYFEESISNLTGVDESALANYQDYTTGTTSYAAFARLTAHLTDDLRAVGGVRYTHDEKQFNGSSTDLLLICVAPGCPTTPLFQAFVSSSQLPFAIPPLGVPVGRGPGPGTIVSRSDIILNAHQDTSEPTWRAALEYDLTPHSLLYASVETGFRSGGFNLAEGYTTFKPEFITAYTIGSKNRFLENRVQVNLEGFYWNYHDQQEPHIGIDLGGNQGYFTQNIGGATIKGAEIEGRFLVTPTTLLSTDLQYLDASYDSYTYQAPVRGGPPYTPCAVSPSSSPTLYNVNCSGMPAYNSPRWTINLAAQQTFEFGDFKTVIGVDTQYRGSNYIGL